MIRKIVVTGEMVNSLKIRKIKVNTNFFRNRRQLNILSPSSIKKNFTILKPDCVIHLAGLSRPMSVHEKNKLRIDLNIIGTTKSCKNL